MNNKTKAAVIGGVVLGILSGIPFINIPNVCCCAWAIVGGLIATYMYVKGSAEPARPGDGAVLGALAGIIGAVIFVVLNVPLSLALGNTMAGAMSSIMSQANPEQAAAMQQMMAQSTGFVGVLINSLIWAVLLVIFATIGGLLGVPLFEKRKGGAGAPPPPPPAYGGGQPGGGYGGGYGS